MKILSISITICLFSCSALAYEPAMLKSTGEMTDGAGNVIAVLNKEDPRNNEHEYYYSSIDSNGNPSKNSSYILTSNPLNPLAGFVKYDISKGEKPSKDGDEKAPETASTSEKTASFTPEPNEKMTKNYDQSTSYNIQDISKPRYEQDYKLETLYK